ncbi:MAG: ATP-binding protein [Rhodobacteraceae bacterium]|nr:ATP-binding protein [Paracoccaceae bacterium]
MFSKHLVTLRSRILVLVGALIAAILLLVALYSLNLNRFDRHVANFQQSMLPRLESAYALEDLSYSIISHSGKFGAAQTEDDLQQAYTSILADIVVLEAMTSVQGSQMNAFSSLKLNRLVEGLKHSLNTTLALKSAAFSQSSVEKARQLRSQIALNRLVFVNDLEELRTYAIVNRSDALVSTHEGLLQLKTRTAADRQLIFGILLAAFASAAIIASSTVLRVRRGLAELGGVLRQTQADFSARFFRTQDEFSEIGERVLHFINESRELADAKNKAAENQLRAEVYEEAIANLTHDLRTPASQIAGLLTLLEDQLPAGQHRPREILMAKAASRRLGGLIQDVLDLSDRDGAAEQAVLGAFQPARTFEELIISFLFTAETKGLKLKLVNELSVGTIVQDERRIQRIAANLVDNAIKYTNTGAVTLKIANQPTVDGLSDLVIEVRDTGIGIPKDQISEIFRKFERAKNHFAINGLGLGLSLVAKFTKLLGGTITVESELSRFTVFKVVIPCEVLSVVGKDNDAKDAQRSYSGRPKVLVVDDDVFNLELASSILRQYSDVTCAANGQEAVSRLQKERFDLVIMDWRMPVMDGLTATLEIRRAERDSNRSRTPIFGLTANASFAEREKALHAGMNELLAKPLTRDDAARLLDSARIGEVA